MEELEEYFIKPLNNALNIEHQLNVMEEKIQKLLDLPQEEDPKSERSKTAIAPAGNGLSAFRHVSTSPSRNP